MLFYTSFAWSKNFVIADSTQKKEIIFSEEEYNGLLNFTPKSFFGNQKTKPKNRFLYVDLNTISLLELRYAYQQQLFLTTSEIQWLEDEINALAIAFFADGKLIILKRAGNYNDYNGCGIETQVRKQITVTVIDFCFTYQSGLAFENRFFEIFNNRTEKLIAVGKQ